MHVAGVADRVRNDCKQLTATSNEAANESQAFSGYVDSVLNEIFASEAVLA